MSSSWNCSAQYCSGASVKESLRPSQLRPVTARPTPLTRRPGIAEVKVGAIVSAAKSSPTFHSAQATARGVLPFCHAAIVSGVGFFRCSVGESIFPLKGSRGEPDGPMPDAAKINKSDVTAIVVAVRAIRFAATLPSRRFISMDSSPSPHVTRMEYQCFPTIALGMEISTSVFERSSRPPDAVTRATSPSDQIVWGVARSGTVGQTQQWMLTARPATAAGRGNSAYDPTAVFLDAPGNGLVQ